jgi:molybdopterin synthase catalytic subunit
LLFAGIRARLGVPHLEVELPDRADPPTVASLRQHLARAHPELADALVHCRVAVDHEFAREDQAILEHAELALIPPVSGGAPIEQIGQRSVLREAALSLAEVVAAVEHRDAGGVATFTGNVREHSRGKRVRWLEYEAYAPMAVAKMDEIALAIEAELPGARVAVQHRRNGDERSGSPEGHRFGLARYVAIRRNRGDHRCCDSSGLTASAVR